VIHHFEDYAGDWHTKLERREESFISDSLAEHHQQKLSSSHSGQTCLKTKVLGSPIFVQIS
jgi:hypothetical protein